MGTPSLFPQFLKRGAGTGGATFVRINLDEIDFELEPEPTAALEATITATVEPEATAAIESGELSGTVQPDNVADLEDEFDGEVDC